MYIAHTLADLRQHLRPFNSPSFVPTMGNLHDGHLALIRQGKPLGDVTVSSIFVNRLQFGPNEDFDSYPRTLEADCAKLKEAGCDVLFVPSEKELYPEPQVFKMQPPSEISDILEGHFRPGFFGGVSTVVMKLFQCVFSEAKGHRTALFGKKDYQQLMVIRRMVQQFALPITIVGGETQRSDKGLALSSRNSYLNPVQLEQALQLSQVLKSLGETFIRSGRDAGLLEDMETEAFNQLRHQGWQPDYLTVRRRVDLQLPRKPSDELVVLGAARLGSTRLIDNFEI
jgi:pantoate--beta-alanine ligase